MDERGNVVLFILLGFAVILLLPPLILYLFPAADILFRIIAVFVIFSTVRGYIGEGTITYIISAILIYFLVFKYTYIFASVYVFQMLLAVSFTSVVIWGIGTRMKG